MSFEIREFVGKPEAVMYHLDVQSGIHPSAEPLFKHVREAARVYCERLQKGSNALVLFRARGFVASDGTAELEVTLRTLRSVP